MATGIIVDVEATPAHRTQEVESTKTMVDRVQERFGMKPNTRPKLSCTLRITFTMAQLVFGVNQSPNGYVEGRNGLRLVASAE